MELTGPEAHHLATVCRLRPGETVCLFNGNGQEYPAVVQEVGKKSVLLDVKAVEAPKRELPFALNVAVPLPRGDRAQFLVEKLTELGVSTYFPLSTQRSVVQPREAKMEKLERYVIEASKQCGRNVLMKIEPLTNWREYCPRGHKDAVNLIAHPGTLASAQELVPLLEKVAEVEIAVGPEGGFTEEEVSLALQNGWQQIGMGPRIFRVETAALVLASWVVAWKG